MDKLNLDLDDLEVDSFQTDPEQDEKQGTVHGNETRDPDRCATKIGGTCDYTCDASCVGTCDFTCEFTCDGPTCRPSCAPSCYFCS